MVGDDEFKVFKILRHRMDSTESVNILPPLYKGRPIVTVGMMFADDRRPV